MAFDGDLEIHLTVSDGSNLTGLPIVAVSLRWKFLHIVLARGKTPSQPMLTRHIKGDLNAAHHEARVATLTLEAEGFTVTRTKIEAAPWNRDVPQTNAHTAPERHFETHIKLLLPSDADIDALLAVTTTHEAHLSRNAFKHRTDGWQERFVTQRTFGAGADTAHTRFAALLHDLAPLGYTVLDTEEEYVVFDSNLQIDAGWLAATNAQEKTR